MSINPSANVYLHRIDYWRISEMVYDDHHRHQLSYLNHHHSFHESSPIIVAEVSAREENSQISLIKKPT